MRRFLKHLLAFALLGSAAAPATAQSAPAVYDFQITWPQPQTRQYHVQLTTAATAGPHTDFAVAAWRPGRYSLQNYAAAVTGFEATDDQGKPLAWSKLDKDTWRVQNPASGKQVTVRYRFYANVMHNGASYLDGRYVFFNPVNLCLYVPGQLQRPARLTLPSLPADWKVATQLTPTDRPNVFTAPDWHELADAPVLAAPDLQQWRWTLDGVTFTAHWLGFPAPPAEAKDAYIDNVSRIIRAQKAVFGELPLQQYEFMYLLHPQPTGATEHSRSAMFIVNQNLAASPRAIGGVYGITSHEFLHLWNVKRVRPAVMWPYDYSQPAYTSLLWLSEGFTEYYADLAQARAGVFSREQYFQELSNLLTNLENDPTAFTYSPSQSSTNSWLEGAQFLDINAVRSPMAFYGIGARVGLLLDLEIRRRTNHAKSLDDVMRWLYTEYYKQDKGVPEDGVQRAAEAVTGQRMADWFAKYVHSPAPVDYQPIFSPLGLELSVTPDQAEAGLKAIGIDILVQGPAGPLVYAVRHGSDASKAGLAPRSTLKAVDGKPVGEWLVDYMAGLKPGDTVPLTVLDNGVTRELRVTFTGNDVPKSLVLRPRAGADTVWIDRWLGN